MRKGVSMQFGLFYEAPEEPRHTHAARFAAMLDLIVYGESLGFDVAWLAESHFGGAFSLLSAPLMVVPAIAARPQRIRPGTAVSLLPLHHPLSLAEHVADAFGLGQSICWFDQGGRLPSAEVKRTMAQCADAVMPKV
jgi:alkanesulfonate monooxygenase SsuD/methylene tetrahydromethanopterin reductase-like flavin-dependent oxidoreductase (luciferase family)